MPNNPITPNTPFEDLLNQVAVPASPGIRDMVTTNSEWSQGTYGINDFHAQVAKAMGASEEKAPRLISPSQVDTSGRFPLQVLGADNEDLYAQGQTWYSKMFNDIGKATSIAGTTFLQSTVGLVNGVFQAINDGKASSFYDNDFNRSLDTWNKDLENSLPNYYSAAERARPWYQNIFTANFLFDKILKNVGFTVGAALSGNVYSKLLDAAKLFATGKALTALEASEDAIMTGRASETIGKLKKSFTGFNSTYSNLNEAQKLLVSGLSTVGEATFEALQASDELKDRLIKEYKEKNLIDPTGDALQQIYDTTSKAGNTDFLLNIPILTASNFIQFPRLLNSSTKSERGMFADLVRKAENVGFDEKTLSYIDKTGAKFGKLFNKVRPYTFSVTEGLEEAQQYAAQTGSENYWYKKYQGQDANVTSDLLGYGANKALGPEGQEQFFIGGISGSLGKMRGTYNEQKRNSQNNQNFLQQSNQTNLGTYARQTFDAINRGNVIQRDRQEALRQGDVLEAKDLERDFITNYLTPKITHGRMDLFNDEISAYKQIASTKDGFQRLQDQGRALPNDTQQDYLQRLDNLQNIAKSAMVSFDTLNTRFGFTFKRDSEGNVIKDEKGKPVLKYNQDVIDKMLYATSKIQDYDDRIPQLSTNLQAAGIDVDSVINTPDAAVEEAKKIDNLTNIGGSSITSDTKTQLKQDLIDLAELSSRRSQFLSEYDDMVKQPDKYEETPGAAPKAQTVKVKTKVGDEDLEIGTEYYLGKVTEHDAKGNEVYRFPRITIIGENEDGTIRIRAANGNIKDISKETLADYKLGKVSDLQSNKKAMFYFEHINDVFEFNFGKGKKKRGRLVYSPKEGILNFVYKNDKGKVSTIEVTGDQFVPKKGYKQALINKVGTLTAVQQKALEDFSKDKDDRTEAKNAARVKIITDLTNEAYENLDKTEKLIKQRNEDLNKINSDLEETEKKINNGDLTKAKKFKAATKTALKTAQRLSRLRADIQDEIQSLTTQKEDLEVNIAYFEDFASHIDELPTDTKEFLEELNDQVLDLQILHEDTGKKINQFSDLLKKVEGSLQKAVDYAFDLIDKFEKKYPNLPVAPDQLRQFLNRDLEFKGVYPGYESYLQANPNLLTDLQEFDREIADIDDLDITPNERTIKELNEEVKVIQKDLKDIESELRAKSSVLEKFQKIADDHIKSQKEEKALQENTELQRDIFKSQKEIEAQSGINNGNFDSQKDIDKDIKEQEEADKDRKKPTEILFSSTTSASELREPDNTVTPRVIRERNFLFNQTFFPPRVKQNIKGITVTTNNQKQLGLDGLIEMVAGDNFTSKLDDIDNGPIALIYTVERDGDLFYLDENGKELGRVGEKVDINKLVASTLSSTSTTWRDGTSRVREGQQDLANNLASQWRVKREETFKNNGYYSYDIGFSRGLPIYDETPDGYKMTNLGGSLFPEDQKSTISSHQGAIKVITTNQYTHGELNYVVKPGTAYFEYQDRFAPIANRRFTPQEQDTLYNSLLQLAIQAKDTKSIKGDLLNFLSNTLYWGTPQNKAGRNQIWIDKSFQLNFGNNGSSIPFTPSSIEANKQILTAYLSGTYSNINNHTLTNKFNDVFIEHYMDKGELKTKEHKNYQTYLLDNNLVQTPIIQESKAPSNRNFQQKYAILQNLEFVLPEQEKVIEKHIQETAKMSEADAFNAILMQNYAENQGPTVDTPAVVISSKTKEPELSEAEKLQQILQSNQVSDAKAPPIQDAEYRAVESFQVERMSAEEIAEFEKFMKENLPQFEIRDVEHLITMTGDKKAWGQLIGKVIEVYKKAEKGTGYHEAFEGVWKYFMNPEEQDAILNEVKNREGFFTDRQTSETLAYGDASDFQVKEVLADEFAGYKYGKHIPGISQRIKDFFNRIINFFRSFIPGYKPNTSLVDKLFDRINAGGFRNAKLPKVLSDQPEFASVRNLSEAQTHSFVQDMTKRVFITLLREGVDLFEPSSYEGENVVESLRAAYNTKVEGKSAMDSLPEGEATFNQLVARTKSFLRTFRIEFDEDNNVTINDDNQTKNDYADDKMKVDIKKSSPFAIKYILASLAKTLGANDTGGVSYQASITGGYELLPFAKTFVNLLETFEGSTSLDHMINKLRQLSRANSDFIPLLNMLGRKGGESLDWENLSSSQWRMLSGFYNTFNKQRPATQFLNYSEGGEVYFNNAEIGRASQQVKSKWESNIRFNAKNGNNIFIGYNKVTKLFGVDRAILKKYDSTSQTISGKIQFLAALGIDFDRLIFDKLNAIQRPKFGNAVNSILTYLSSNQGVKIVNSEAVGISKAVTTLSELYAKAVNPQSESTFISGIGEQKQVFIQPDYVSQFNNIFNTVINKEQLYEKFPYLRNDVYGVNSQILKNGGVYFDTNGNRTSVNLVIGYTDAIKTERGGKEISDLEYPERIMTQINNVLDSKYYIGVPADSSTERNLDMPEFIDFTSASEEERFLKKTTDIFTGYLKDEIELAKEDHSYVDNIGKKSDELRFFKYILSESNLEKMAKVIKDDLPFTETESIRADINKYIKSEIASLKKTLEYNQSIVNQGEDNYSMPGILDEFASKKNKIDKNSLTGNEVDSIIRYVIGNSLVANTEIHKVLFGDPYSFALRTKNNKLILDETKRIKSFLSPAQPTLVSSHYNNTFNKEFNKGLTPGTFGYHTFKDSVDTITFRDINISTELYPDVNEADAQALHTIMMHRDLLNRQGQWSRKAEAWFQWEMAYTRDSLSKKGIEFEYPEELKRADQKLIERRKPEYFLHVIKPIVRGIKANSDFVNPILDKFSSAPLFYSGVEGTNGEKLFVKMFKENIDYAIFESGRKVGSEGKNDLYTQDGKFNTDPYIGKLTLNWSDYSVQVENAYDKGKKQTRGSQITKLFSADFMSGGVPIDYNFADWSSLSEAEREKESPVYKEIKWNNTLLENMTSNGYDNLLDKLGMTDTGSSFLVHDYKRLYSTLSDEAFKRDMPENTKKLFEINEETGLPYLPLEASSEYTKIQKMLYSVVDNTIVSPKVNGGAKTQLSAVGWEDSSKGRDLVLKTDKGYKKISEAEYNKLSAAEKKNVRLTSSALKFYTKDDPYMEILLPHWFKDKFRKLGFKSDLQLMEYLNDSEEGKSILRGIGFRIPTQGMSAIEAFRVKGFLAQEYGDTVVVPSEITTKAGSDFDIDKLNTYLKNTYVDANNKLRLVPFYGFGEQAIKEFEKLAISLKKFKADETDTDPWANDFEESVSQAEEDKFNKHVKSLYSQSLENEYFSSLERMITHPLNYERLVQPTENTTLPRLADKMAQLTNTEDKNTLTNLLSIDYLSKLRHAFLVAKKWVGIGAVNITGHSQAQRTELLIDVRNTQLSLKDKEILGDGKILLPHNSVNGKPTLSERFDKAGKYISDKLSWYITAFVDVAKDPYILKIIPSRKVVGTFMFLERVGVPTDTLASFMNQPIIREYVHYSDIQGFSRLANPYWRDQFLKEGNFNYNPESKPSDKIDLKSLDSNIDKYYHGKDIDNTQQGLILNEFLKYYKMAEYLFNFTQSTNWDTARFTTGAAVRKKQIKLSKESQYNIIKSPENILAISNNGKVRDAVIASKEAIEAISKLTSPEVRNELNVSLDRYLNLSYLPEKVLEKIDSQLVNSLMDYMVQTKAFNNIKGLILDESTSIIKKVKDIQASGNVNNPIFTNLAVQVSNNEGGADNLKLTPFPKDVYDKNLITGYLKELRDVSLDTTGKLKSDSIYAGLIKLSLLQGTGSASNLMSYIPLQDIASVLQPIIGNITKEDVKNYVRNFNFEKNNWKNSDIVPEFGPLTSARYQFPTKFGTKVLKLSDIYNASQVEYPMLKLNRYNKIKKSAARWDLVTNKQIPLDTIKDMVSKKDYSFLDAAGYQKVMLPNGEPLIKVETDKKGLVHNYYFYRQTNLLGTNEIQEHYSGEQKSVINNSTVKVDTLTDEEISKEVLGEIPYNNLLKKLNLRNGEC